MVLSVFCTTERSCSLPLTIQISTSQLTSQQNKSIAQVILRSLRRKRLPCHLKHVRMVFLSGVKWFNRQITCFHYMILCFKWPFFCWFLHVTSSKFKAKELSVFLTFFLPEVLVEQHNTYIFTEIFSWKLG